MEAYARLLRRRGERDAASVALTAGPVWQAYGYDNPALGGWRTDAALFASGDAPGARRLAAEELQRAERWGAPRAYGRALRVVGQVTGGSTVSRCCSDRSRCWRAARLGWSRCARSRNWVPRYAGSAAAPRRSAARWRPRVAA
jgi:hypothetical protein